MGVYNCQPLDKSMRVHCEELNVKKPFNEYLCGGKYYYKMNALSQQLTLPLLTEKRIALYIKREDRIHPFISGNKYRKLKYNLIEAKKRNLDTILTFGGAYSNHIVATAYAGKENGFYTVGIVRGEEIANKWIENPTLKTAKSHGMDFKFVSREQYRKKEDPIFLNKLEKEYRPYHILPEGGTNDLAIKGCEEILTEKDTSLDVVCCSVGTGGTMAGIINSSRPDQKIIGFPALKGDFLQENIRKFANRENWFLQTDYHFGGYAKVSENLINFINEFKSLTNIPLDPIYTGKQLYGVIDLIKKDFFKPKTKILVVHSGGLQGIRGMNAKLKRKKLPLIIV